MDWRNVAFDWNHARALLATADEGSLTAAARALGTTQPTVGRQIDALEAELGVVLFERVGRSLEPTPVARELLDHVRVMAEAAARLSLGASGHSQHLAGEIRISAGEVFAAVRLPKVLAALRRAHPAIEVVLLATNAPSDLQRREADIAVRSFRPNQPELVAKKLGEVQGTLYATPDYLARLGPIANPSTLSRAQFIGFDESPQLLDVLNGLGLSLTRENVQVRCENHLVHWELVKHGLGIGVMQHDIGDAEPSLVRVPVNIPTLPIPVWLTAHRELHTSRKVRTVFDFLYEALRGALRDDDPD